MSSAAEWRALARHSPLVVLLDLDGTLIPFAPTPDAVIVDDDLLALLRSLTRLPETTVAVVSGRPRDWLERQLGGVEDLCLVAEHGGHRRGRGAWERTVEVDAGPLGELAEALERIARREPGALVERKTWSLTFHVRPVRADRRTELVVQAMAAMRPWLLAHPSYELAEGAEILEIRPTGMRKSSAVPWARSLAGPDARVLAMGDDLTDEHMFAALCALDASVLVSASPPRRPTAAGARVDGPAHARSFLRWMVAIRSGEPAGNDVQLPTALGTMRIEPPATHGLLVVSNRLPHLRVEIVPTGTGLREARKRNVGGLVSALEPALRERRGLWLGWSGRTVPDSETPAHGIDDTEQPALAWLDFRERWLRGHYNGMSNRTLWPLFHSFPERVRLDGREWEAYVEANDAFADAAIRLVGKGDPIWAHDYHLLLLARALRRRGHQGPIGLFLHIPFPPEDILAILPWASELMDAMLDYDLVAFHTPGYAANFLRSASSFVGAGRGEDVVEHRGRRTRVRAIPIGIFPDGFREPAPPDVMAEATELALQLRDRKLVLGVDRLDYTKGIPERLIAFSRLLELHPEWRNRVSFVQVSVPSREDVPAYAEQRERIENLVGRINGEHGEAHWTPVRYLYRSYGRDMLSQLYRMAHVGLVTPLRDGMNLVAKEYVAAQAPEDPGVLVLSRLAGAAVELRDAVLTNPWYSDGMAEDIALALRMPLEERKRRHASLLSAVERTTALTWAREFLRELHG